MNENRFMYMMILSLFQVRCLGSLTYSIKKKKSPDFFPPRDFGNSNSTHFLKVLILDSCLFKLREAALAQVHFPVSRQSSVMHHLRKVLGSFHGAKCTERASTSRSSDVPAQNSNFCICTCLFG